MQKFISVYFTFRHPTKIYARFYDGAEQRTEHMLCLHLYCWNDVKKNQRKRW